MIVFIIGVLICVTPFLGIPSDWKQTTFVVSGVLLMLFGYRLRYERFLRSIRDSETGEYKTDSFVEATPHLFNEDTKNST